MLLTLRHAIPDARFLVIPAKAGIQLLLVSAFAAAGTSRASRARSGR